MSNSSLKATIYSAEKKESRLALLAKELGEEMNASTHIILQAFIPGLKAAYRKTTLVIDGLS